MGGHFRYDLIEGGEALCDKDGAPAGSAVQNAKAWKDACDTALDRKVMETDKAWYNARIAKITRNDLTESLAYEMMITHYGWNAYFKKNRSGEAKFQRGLNTWAAVVKKAEARAAKCENAFLWTFLQRERSRPCQQWIDSLDETMKRDLVDSL